MVKNTSSLKHTKKCDYCGKDFISYISNNRKYCSHKCANTASAPIRKRQVIFICEICSKEISVARSTLKFRKPRFCSHNCSKKGSIQKEKHAITYCNECKKPKDVLISRKIKNKYNFCNIKCRIKYCKKNPLNTRNGFWYENGYKVLYTSNGEGIKEHIKIMQDHLCRELKDDEIVHHVNQIKDDNRLVNLKIMTKSEHSSYHRKKEKKEGKHLFGGYNNN